MASVPDIQLACIAVHVFLWFEVALFQPVTNGLHQYVSCHYRENIFCYGSRLLYPGAGNTALARFQYLLDSWASHLSVIFLNARGQGTIEAGDPQGHMRPGDDQFPLDDRVGCRCETSGTCPADREMVTVRPLSSTSLRGGHAVSPPCDQSQCPDLARAIRSLFSPGDIQENIDCRSHLSDMAFRDYHYDLWPDRNFDRCFLRG